MTGTEEFADDGGTDEACCSCDENTHKKVLLSLVRSSMSVIK
jgi:hypothetical protein